MKYSDISRLCQDGLISAEQRDRIQEHYHLKESGNRVVGLFSIIGAILVSSGFILVISSNWDEIPRLAKVFGGLFLMLGAHATGYYLKVIRQNYFKLSEAMHFIGSILFLANIALIGQVYNLSSRPPNGILLWWLGIVALPWLLRSTVQHILSLGALLTWLGYETLYNDSWLHFASDQRVVILWAVIGLFVYGGGLALQRSRTPEYACSTQIIGLMIFNFLSLPLIFKWFYHFYEWEVFSDTRAMGLFGGTLLVALLLCQWGLSGIRTLSPSRRKWWMYSLLIIGLLLVGSPWLSLLLPVADSYNYSNSHYWVVMATALFVFALMQIHVGVELKQSAYVNLAVIMVAIILISVYITLFGSMARTGLVFVIGGVLMIVLGVFLEKKRRMIITAVKGGGTQGDVNEI